MVFAMTLLLLQTKRDALLSAMMAGLLEVTSGDKTLRYQNIDQMRDALAILDKEIAVASGTTLARTVLIQHSRG